MTETLKFRVIKKEKNFELRDYAAFIQAEVSIESKTFRLAVERAFNILAGYIFGNNISSQKIAMTTPVTTSRSEKIAMTTPVTVSGKGVYTVAFSMPSKYSMQNLPVPIDERVKLRGVPAYQAAVIHFTGYFNEEKIGRHKELLRLWVEEQGLTIQGEFVVAGYNPPWVPGFLARNEVLVKVQ